MGQALASRSFDLGKPLAAFVPRQRLQDAWLRNNYDCVAAGRSLAVLVNGYRGGGHAICRSELARDLLIFSTGEKKDLDNQGLS